MCPLGNALRLNQFILTLKILHSLIQFFFNTYFTENTNTPAVGISVVPINALAPFDKLKV